MSQEFDRKEYRHIARHLSRIPDTLRSVTFVRLVLIALLALTQAIDLSYSASLLFRTPLWIVPALAMDALFALAGFTFARALDRHGPALTLKRSVLRFLPALAIVVAFTALVVGPAITVQRPGVYFTDVRTWTYLLNLAGYAQTVLPGAFTDRNLIATVNGVMWIVPIAYVAVFVTVLSDVRPNFRRGTMAAFAVLVIVIGLLIESDLTPWSVSHSEAETVIGRTNGAVMAFIAGVAAYRDRAHVVQSRRVAGAVAAAIAALAVFGDRGLLGDVLVAAVVAAAAAYMAIFASSFRLALRHAADRYEPLLWRFFLLVYPAAQFWIAVGPGQQVFWFNLALAVPTATLAAGAMWHGIEKPLLRRLAPTIVEGHPFYGREAAAYGPFHFQPVAWLRALLPHVLTAVVVALLALGAIAVALLAMQRDPGGV